MMIRLIRVICCALAAWLWAACPAHAVQVRVASFNVYFGVDTGGDRLSNDPNDDYLAVSNILRRVNPDIVTFQELSNSDQEAWVTMAAQLGYPYYAFSSFLGGTFAGSHRLGIWSRYPILAASEIKETVVDPDAKEMTRWPLHAVIQVPGALNPFHVITVHNKANTTEKASRMRRALEIYRTLNYLTDTNNVPGLDVEYAIMGDFNDTIEGSVGLGQTTNFPRWAGAHCLRPTRPATTSPGTPIPAGCCRIATIRPTAWLRPGCRSWMLFTPGAPTRGPMGPGLMAVIDSTTCSSATKS